MEVVLAAAIWLTFANVYDADISPGKIATFMLGPGRSTFGTIGLNKKTLIKKIRRTVHASEAYHFGKGCQTFWVDQEKGRYERLYVEARQKIGFPPESSANESDSAVPVPIESSPETPTPTHASPARHLSKNDEWITEASRSMDAGHSTMHSRRYDQGNNLNSFPNIRLQVVNDIPHGFCKCTDVSACLALQNIASSNFKASRSGQFFLDFNAFTPSKQQIGSLNGAVLEFIAARRFAAGSGSLNANQLEVDMCKHLVSMLIFSNTSLSIWSLTGAILKVKEWEEDIALFK